MSTETDGVWTAGMVTGGEVPVVGGPVGGVPVEVATLVMVPASRSAWVTVWVAPQLMEAPGAKEATGVVGVQVPTVALASATVTLVKVTLPLLVAVMV